MALHVDKLTRVFLLNKGGGKKDIELKDPNPELSPEEALKFYSGTHPELTNATIHGPKVDGGKAVYNFKTVVGTKG